MRGIRHRLASLVVLWIVGQGVGLAAVPVALCAKAAESRPQVECTCDHGDGQACPMHHPETQSRPCSCRGTTDGADGVIVSLLGNVAVLPASTAVFPLATAPERRYDAGTPLFDGFGVPDGPPPRA